MLSGRGAVKVARHVSSSTSRTFSSTPSHAARDVLERSARPTTAPQRINIYKEIWPPLIVGLGVATAAFYVLELSRLHLDYKYRVQDQALEIEALRAECDKLREVNELRNAPLSSKIFGGSSSNSEGRSKWFGIF